MYCPYENIVNFSRTSRIHFCFPKTSPFPWRMWTHLIHPSSADPTHHPKWHPDPVRMIFSKIHLLDRPTDRQIALATSLFQHPLTLYGLYLATRQIVVAIKYTGIESAYKTALLIWSYVPHELHCSFFGRTYKENAAPSATLLHGRNMI